MESLNRKHKDYRRAARGSSNCNYTRNRILWATRNNPSILAIPKTGDEIHKDSLPKKTADKRSKKYNTKKSMTS